MVICFDSDHSALRDETASLGIPKFVTDSYCPGPKLPPTFSTKFEWRKNSHVRESITKDDILSVKSGVFSIVKIGLLPEDVTMPPSKIPVLKDNYVFITMRHKILLSIRLAVDESWQLPGATATISSHTTRAKG